MKKGLATLATAMLCISAANAAPSAGGKPVGLNEGQTDLLAARADVMRALKAGPTEAEVGDVDSFGRSQTYLGLSQTKPVVLQADCTGSDPAFEACVETNPAPAATPVDESNLGMIELPKHASNSILCFTFTQFSTWLWFNSTASQATGDMSLYLTVQVENDALNGINDINGNPFNGFLFLDGVGVPTPTPIIVSTHQHTLPAGAFEIQRERNTRSCTGGIVSARSLRAQGLTDQQVKKFFKEPMTISFGAAGSASLVDFATFFGGIRVYGD